MILVFKTNVNQVSEPNVLKTLSSIKEIEKINFDFEDCDQILRIESNKNMITEIEALLTAQGFYCKAL